MTRALLAFYAPWQRLAGLGLLAAITSATLLALGLPARFVPVGFIFLIWAAAASYFDLPTTALSAWERAWPVRPHTLRWSQILGSWLLGWVAIVTSQAAVSLEWALGVVSTSEWLVFSYQALCLFGVIPLVSGLAAQLRLRLRVRLATVLAVICFPTYLLNLQTDLLLALPQSLGLDLALGSASLIALLAGAIGVWLMPTGQLENVAERELGPHHSERRQRSGLEHRVARARFIVARFVCLDLSPHPVSFWASAALLLLGVTAYHAKGYLWLGAIGAWAFQYLASLPGHLPISRARLLGYFLVPLAVSGAISFSTAYARYGYRAIFTQPPQGERTDLRAAERLVVPNLLWRATWGEPPRIGAPGALRSPTAYSVIPGLPLYVYNPYEARFDEDPRFVTHQISGALRESTRVELSAADVSRACERFQGLELPLEACVSVEFTTPYQPPLAWRRVTAWAFSVLVLQGLVSVFALRRYFSSGHARWTLALEVLWGVLALCLATAADMATYHLVVNEPHGFFQPLFKLGVLLGELTRLVEKAPFVMAFAGLGTLAALSWRLLRSFQNAELGQGAAGRAS